MRVPGVLCLVALLAVTGCTARASEDEARRQVQAMADAPLMQALAGGTVKMTRRDVCGGGSVAPYVDRTVIGDAGRAEPAYRQLAVADGWKVEGSPPGSAAGFGAYKGERFFGFRRSPSGWSLFMSHGDEAAECVEPGPDADVTTQGY